MMERENFYIILELSVDPPETDLGVINRAIANKKAQWSRLRNHPTKGLQIQKYLNMIPEIQRVMLDRELRRQEADAAKAFLQKGMEAKFSEIDRHIEILMGKGFIAKEEITRLADLHNIPQNEIQERINAKKQEKFIRIDLEIGYRMAKGYLTETEVARIAKHHALTVEEIKSRVRCPVTRDAKDKAALKPKQIDPSINKSILDNLKIVDKGSLYDFLGMPSSSPLAMLQEKSVQKKKQLASISKKDAVATASSILAGHCMTLFKNEESRLAYDISLSLSFLAELDSDIDVAAINGAIRPEYQNILIEKAMGLGMDEDEAREYIKSYGRKKKYQIEQNPDRKKRLIIMSAAGALAIILLVAGFMALSVIHEKRSAESAYQALLTRAESQPDPGEKIKIFKAYLNSRPKAEYAASVNERIAGLEKQVARQALDEVEARAGKMMEQEAYENARETYQNFLKDHPGTPFKADVAGRMDKIEKQIEARDFEHLTGIMRQAGVDEKIAACRNYLALHPKGAHKTQTEEFIREMSNEYYIYINREFSKCKEKEDWQGCLDLCSSYTALYDNANSDLLKQLVPAYEKKLKDQQTFETIVQKTGALGAEYATARQVFIDYLEAYPDTTVRDKVQLELARIDHMEMLHHINLKKQQMQDLLQTTSGRFVERQEGIVIDTRTGLMWCLADTGIIMGDECVNYEKAKSFTDALDTGGYTDWRLPTAAELAAIYRSAPAFPAPAEQWYWTSDAFSSYADGWHTRVATVSNQPAESEIVRRDDRDCGAVRAVRGSVKELT